jgi:hypothetical protein
MPMGIGLGIGVTRFSGVGGFSPASLFAAGEPGVWYDPSDFSTMFQDSAGTTPVTAVEQPVGRILDKSGRGNHATQSTSASRPVLSARVNLLTWSDDFRNTADAGSTRPWTYTNGFGGITVTPDALESLDKIVLANGVAGYVGFGGGATILNGSIYTFSLVVAAAEYSYIQLGGDLVSGRISATSVFNLNNGTVQSTLFGTAAIQSLGGGLYRCSVTGLSSATTAQPFFRPYSNATTAATGNGVNGIYVGRADLRVTNDGVNLPVYQRVNTSTDYDTTGFPYYLRFDGSDDSMVTNTITPGIDKAQVFAGVRKLSDAAQAVVAEMSATIASNNGTFLLAAPNTASATFAFDSKGTTQVDAIASSLTAPLTRVVTGIGDISGDTAIIRINGVQADQETSDQGTGNYLAYPLYIGRRNNATLPLNGRIYSLITRFGANLDATTITDTETWVNGKTKAY